MTTVELARARPSLYLSQCRVVHLLTLLHHVHYFVLSVRLHGTLSHAWVLGARARVLRHELRIGQVEVGHAFSVLRVVLSA